MSSFQQKMKLSLSSLSLSSAISRINSRNQIITIDPKERDDSTCCSESSSSSNMDDGDDVLLMEEKEEEVPLLIDAITNDDDDHQKKKTLCDPYASNSFIGYSLWLCPTTTTTTTTTTYQGLINSLSTEWKTRNFVPHITLLGGITSIDSKDEVIRKTKQFVKRLGGLSHITFEYDSISSQQRYFQCIYAKMKVTKQVQDLYHLAQEVMLDTTTDNDDTKYMPHLSLLYGDIPQCIKTNQIIPQINKQINHHTMMINDNNHNNKVNDDEYYNNNDENNKKYHNHTETTSQRKRTPSSLSSSSIKHIKVDSIQIWSTQGDVKDWYLVDTIPLSLFS